MDQGRALAATGVLVGSFALLGACSSIYGEDTPPPAPQPAEAGGVADADGSAAGGGDAAPVEASAPIDSGADAGPGCNGAIDCERVVFVSSVDFTGALGGLAGADGQCQALADASQHPRVRGRRFMAWLSTSKRPVTERLPHGTKPYVLPNGAQIAGDWAALTSGRLDRPIDVDEAGATITSQRAVWTGTRSGGTAGTYDCGGWVDDDELGVRGRNDADDKDWTEESNGSCGNTCRIYCFEH